MTVTNDRKEGKSGLLLANIAIDSWDNEEQELVAHLGRLGRFPYGRSLYNERPTFHMVHKPTQTLDLLTFEPDL